MPAFDMEEWRPVVGYEGWYEVSNLGRVRRAKTSKGTRAGRILKAECAPGTYPHVGLYRNGVGEIVNVHRLVAEAFIGPCPLGYQSNHKNGIKSDNRSVNLEWVTPSGNTRHAVARGLFVPTVPSVRGEANGQSKLKESDVRLIRAARGILTQRELAHRFGVHNSTIWSAQQRKGWKHIAQEQGE